MSDDSVAEEFECYRFQLPCAGCGRLMHRWRGDDDPLCDQCNPVPMFDRPLGNWGTHLVAADELFPYPDLPLASSND